MEPAPRVEVITTRVTAPLDLQVGLDHNTTNTQNMVIWKSLSHKPYIISSWEYYDLIPGLQRAFHILCCIILNAESKNKRVRRKSNKVAKEDEKNENDGRGKEWVNRNKRKMICFLAIPKFSFISLLNRNCVAVDSNLCLANSSKFWN